MNEQMCKIVVRAVGSTGSSSFPHRVIYDLLEVQCPASEFKRVWKDLVDCGFHPEQSRTVNVEVKL